MLNSNKNNNKLLPLRQFVKKGIYNSAYLSNLVQRKKLKAKKIGRNYYTTEAWFNEYLEKHGRDKKRKIKPNDENLLPLRKFSKKGPYNNYYLSNLVQRKKLKAKKIGRNYYTTEAWFNEYLEKHGQKRNNLKDAQKEISSKKIDEININELSNQIVSKIITIAQDNKKNETISKFELTPDKQYAEIGRINKERKKSKLLEFIFYKSRPVRLFFIGTIIFGITFLLIIFKPQTVHHFNNITKAIFLTPVIQLSKLIESIKYFNNNISINDDIKNNELKYLSNSTINESGKVAGVSETNPGYIFLEGDIIYDDAKNSINYFEDGIIATWSLIIKSYEEAYLAFLDFFYRNIDYEKKDIITKDATKDQGAVIVPFENDDQAQEIRQKIEQMFSDQVIVEPDESDRSGIVRPVFGSEVADQKYLYMMVPLVEDK